ncbi:hypothetical protein GCM10022289_01460 [Pedobacter jeongneungensis]|uniref:Uncharacterized protein n=1 Tax=Pedobacter jeongneungensis TaxID=947309 RepID=A0ABP8B224_9SPHI
MHTTIKKVSKGLMAAAFGLLLVVGGSAFKADSNKRVQYTFRYNNADHSLGAVQTLSNWVYDPSAPSCDEEPQEACTIKVDQAYVNTGGTPTLKSTLNLQASAYTTTSAFVIGSDDESMAIENRTAQ